MNLSGHRIFLYISIILFIASFAYKTYEQGQLQQAHAEQRRLVQEIAKTVALQKLWNGKGIKQKLHRLQNTLPKQSIKRFDFHRKSLSILTEDLDGKSLNRFLSRLGALPVQIKTLKIQGTKNRYRMECQCKW